ncbi:MAG: serine/threonine-protein kinase [Myxococcales bacterium]|nr:serine/threonine-protein kinase [Myxococcales bacterium]
MRDQDDTQQPEPGHLLAGRYAVEKEIGRGGMARVYAAVDRASGGQVALKRLSVSGKNAAVHRAHFEREYYTLRQLTHPAIVEAHDYGIEGDTPFYTMEMLPGAGLIPGAPMPWLEAADLLGSVASALAVIHSRRLIHRDISAANLRRTADGRPKVIDFGAMVDMGRVRHLVGTPPYVPPEALHQQPLDQRADIYALGALGYQMLTGAHAYPARTFRELRTRFAVPLRPVCQRNPEVPEALGELIASMLKFDPLARPSSVAELMARLSVITGRTLEEDLEVRSAYLATPKLVGRDDDLAMVRESILRPLRRRGAAILVEGPAGVGRSRFLDACVLEARIAGMTVLRANADSVADFSAIRVLVDGIRRARPGSEQEPPELALLEGERVANADRPGLQSALCRWLLAHAKRRGLLIAIDDLHKLDEPSASLIALLANEAERTRLVVVAAHLLDSSSRAAPAVDLIRRVSQPVVLAPLSGEACTALLRSVFGDVPHVALLADRLHALCDGNPRALVELAQHLVDIGAIRYSIGAWVLPARLGASILPQRVASAYDARIAALSCDGRRLACALALCPEVSLGRDAHAAILQTDDYGRVYGALDELVAAGILGRRDGAYGFGARAWVEPLLAVPDGAEARELRLQVVDVLQATGTEPLLCAGLLIEAGERPRALDLSVSLAGRLLDRDAKEYRDAPWLQISRSREHAKVLKAALLLPELQGRPALDRHRLELALAFTAIYGDFEILKELQPVVLERLVLDSGLSDHAELAHVSDRAQRLREALGRAARRHEQAGEHARVFSPTDAIRFLARLYHHTAATAAATFESGLLDGLPSLSPLAVLSPALDIAAQNVAAVRAMVGGENLAAREAYLRMIARMDEPDRAGHDPVLHQYVRLAFVYATAHIEAGMGMASALAWAERMGEDPLHRVNALRVKTNYYLTVGDALRAKECRREAELLRIQNAPVQFFEGVDLFRYFPPAAISDDLMAVQAAQEGIAEVAERFAGWAPAMHYAQGEYARISGDPHRALLAFRKAMELTEPGTHHIWPRAAEQYLFTLVALGRFHEALERGRAWTRTWQEQRLLGSVGVAMAAAEAAAGECAAAMARIEGIIASWRTQGIGGVELGRAYEVAARIAIKKADRARFGEFERLCGAEYLRGQTPSLVGKYEALMHAAGRVFAEAEPDPRREDPSVLRLMHAELVGLGDAKRLATRSLELLVEMTGASEGWLFWQTADGPRLIAATGNMPAGMMPFVTDFVAMETVDGSTMTATGETLHDTFVCPSGDCLPLVLREPGAGLGALLGIVMLATQVDPFYAISEGSLQVISRALLDCEELASVGS